MIEKQHTLQWLDFVITIALDFSESEVSTLSAAQYGHMTERIEQKKLAYIAYLNNQRFGSRKAAHLVKEHHGRLLTLLDQACHATHGVNPLNTLAARALGQLLASIYELLHFIQSRFGEFLDLDQRATAGYVDAFSRQHHSRVGELQKQLTSKNADPDLAAILFEALSIDSAGRTAPSYRTILYQQELMLGLEQILCSQGHAGIDDALVELLIYLNFNSRRFMDYYTRHVAQRIEKVEAAKEKIHQLRMDYKHFRQMHRRPGIRLSATESDIKKFISNWFVQEIGYLKESVQTSVNEYALMHKSAPNEPLKLMVLLSVDQIGLFLRALDSLRIVKARSMNTVFECIVPFLSTPRRTEISWDSMRSKSYSFEEKDKQALIKVLESVIVWIKEYRR
ncbi:hypothetical protein [Dyadobacter sp. CY312]|uniref:hypothetical protein n=1 Tax=Dyadobacter sp. CY312 TaxID=2907303 RepID=UPI001F3904A5|nr:hypothetical protein [Dyadobacter sp. CY312]MCE7044207.1 hypothetical protein [Dyadobacter sp. CY312]